MTGEGNETCWRWGGKKNDGSETKYRSFYKFTTSQMDREKPAYSINSLTLIPPFLHHLLLLPRSLCLNNSGLLVALGKVFSTCVHVLVCVRLSEDWLLPSNRLFLWFLWFLSTKISEGKSDGMHTWVAECVPHWSSHDKERERKIKMGRESVCNIRCVTHLINDGFSKPRLTYWLKVFALLLPFSPYEECLRENVCVFKEWWMSSLT